MRLLTCVHCRALLVFLLPVLAFSAACKEKRELPPAADYRVFIEASTQLVCEKMIECYSGLFFSISPELRSGINVESCKKAALQNLDFKLSRHTDAMKSLSRACYQAILDSPCKEVGTTFFWNPACFALRAESEKAYRGVAPPALSLPEDSQ